MYVYIKTEPKLWTVGFYSPEGKFNSESDHPDTNSAAERVAFLNGNGSKIRDAILISKELAKEYIEWAKDKSFCNSGMHICDRLANEMEEQIKKDT